MLAPFGGLCANEADEPTIKRYSANITSISLHLPPISGASHPSTQGKLLWTEVFAHAEANSAREHPCVSAPTCKRTCRRRFHRSKSTLRAGQRMDRSMDVLTLAASTWRSRHPLKVLMLRVQILIEWPTLARNRSQKPRPSISFIQYLIIFQEDQMMG